MKSLLCKVVIAVAMACPMASTEVEAKSLRQGVYDQCVDPYNNAIRKKGGKAVVAGWRGNDANWTTTCFWVTGASSDANAQRRAMNSCRKRYPKCAVFGTSAGLQNWSRQISNNAGVDPQSRRRQTAYQQQANDDAVRVLTEFATGLLGGIAAGNSYAPTPRPQQRYQAPRRTGTYGMDKGGNVTPCDTSQPGSCAWR